MLDFLFEEANRTEPASFPPYFVKAFMQTVIKFLQEERQNKEQMFYRTSASYSHTGSQGKMTHRMVIQKSRRTNRLKLKHWDASVLFSPKCAQNGGVLCWAEGGFSCRTKWKRRVMGWKMKRESNSGGGRFLDHGAIRVKDVLHLQISREKARLDVHAETLFCARAKFWFHFFWV